MPPEVTRRRFMSQTMGVIGGATVSGPLPPLRQRRLSANRCCAWPSREILRRSARSCRPGIRQLLRRLIYTTPILWGTQQRPDGSLICTWTVSSGARHRLQVSEDRQRIEFTLQPNAKFANGDPINAQALKESYAWFLGAKGSGQLRVMACPVRSHRGGR